VAVAAATRGGTVPTTCPPHRHRAPAPIRTPEDALATLALATDAGRDPCVVVASLDRSRRPLALLIVDGGTASDVPAALDVVLGGVRRLGAGSPVAALFLACSGASVSEPDEADCALFAGLEARVLGTGMTLLDWFMLSEGSATSVAHRAGRSPAW
jgi:hypothetical protein